MGVSLQEIDQLEGRAAALVGLISAATAELVDVVADALDRKAWVGYGILSPEHWLALRFGLTTAHAKRLTAAAIGLQDLPLTREAFAAGEITEDHVGVIVRAGVTATHDDQAVELARYATVSQLRKGLSFLPRPEPEPEAAAEAEPDADVLPAPESPSRSYVSFGFGDDGRWSLHGELSADQAALVEKALYAARDAEFRSRHGDTIDPTERDDVSWVDALVRLAEQGLDGFDPDTRAGRTPGDRYQVIIHFDGHTGGADLHLGPTLDRLSRRRLCCDAIIRFATNHPDGSVNLGRRARVVDPKLRLVVERRDGGCAIPGCTATHWLTVHHIWHWEDGGPTDTANLITLCPAHHRRVHAGEIRIHGNPDRPETLRIVDARGHPIGPRPPSPPGQPPTDAARHLGINNPRYKTRSGERADWNMMWWRDLPKPKPTEHDEE